MQIYIHIPFCKSKCQYCDFNSYACGDEGVQYSYLAALNREIRLAGKAYGKARIDTVYIGGGTPSMLDERKIVSICKVLKESFDLSHVKEFSIECNPESIEEKKLAAYKECGINRISIGVQSLDDRNLKSMGRLHTANEAIEKIKLANKYFDNVSCDLIVGLPYDTIESVKDEVGALVPLVSHMSVYALTVESGTPLAKRVEEGRILLPCDDEVEDMLEIAEDTLAENGILKYEVSNFARAGKECIHNYGYWTGEEYLGLGSGAHSYIKTKDGKEELAMPIRYSEPKDTNAYIAGVNCAESFDLIPRMDAKVISSVEEENERVMLGLRTTRGVEDKYIQNVIPPELKGFFVSENGYTHLTKAGMAVMNSILVRILKFD